MSTVGPAPILGGGGCRYGYELVDVDVPASVGEEPKLELQVALDRISLDRAAQLTAAVAGHVDWIEVGTSLIKQYGAAGLIRVVHAARTTPVLADLKAVDDVEFELSLAYDCGASSATVLGLASDVTIEKAVVLAGRRGREVMVDLLGVGASRIDELARSLPPGGDPRCPCRQGRPAPWKPPGRFAGPVGHGATRGAGRWSHGGRPAGPHRDSGFAHHRGFGRNHGGGPRRRDTTTASCSRKGHHRP